MLTRRKFLTSVTLLSGLAAIHPRHLWAAPASEKSDTERFYRLSQFLTQRDALSPLVSARALHGLVAEDSDFPNKLQAVERALQQQPIQNSDQLNGHPLMQQPEGQTVRKIISAWYLGYTGTPISLRAKDSTRFVTYTDALMFQPTLDATVIPTYSRGHTNYWTIPPATIQQD